MGTNRVGGCFREREDEHWTYLRSSVLGLFGFVSSVRVSCVSVSKKPTLVSLTAILSLAPVAASAGYLLGRYADVKISVA